VSLDMEGHIDDCLQSIPATRYSQSGARVDGRWVAGPETPTPHKVTLQPLSEREVANLGEGAERVQDYRKIYVNDGDLYSITPQDEWVFDSPELSGLRFTTYRLDNRPWRNYCKCVVHLNDR